MQQIFSNHENNVKVEFQDLHILAQKRIQKQKDQERRQQNKE